MADPVAEQIVDAVVAVLEAVTGPYKPDKVVRAAAFHGGVLDATLGTIYCVSPGILEETRAAFGTLNNVGESMSLGIALCRKFGGSDDSTIGTGGLQRLDEQHQLLKAAEEKIRADRQLGGLALDLIVADKDVSAENTYIEGWAVAFLLIMITYLVSETAA